MNPTRYTLCMLKKRFCIPCGLCAPIIAAALLLTGICGCTSFKVMRQTRFVDMDGRIVHAEYGKEKRTETLPSGIVCTFDGKVRISLFDGQRITLYQTLSTAGNRYVSLNKRYEFTEMGPYCIIQHDGVRIYQGFYCRK